MNTNLNGLNINLFPETTARNVARMTDEMDRYQENVNERNRAILAASEASVAQNKLLEQQLEFMQQQNILLCDNYDKLKEMYENQLQTNQNAKDELVQSKSFNKWMMVVSVIAMLAAIASPIVTAIVS